MKNFYKYGICSWCLPKGEDPCLTASKLSLDGIELDLGNYEQGLPLSKQSAIDKIIDSSNKYNIEISTLALNTLCDHGLGNKNKQKIVREVLKVAVDTASKLNVKLIQLPSFNDGFIRNENQLLETAENIKYVCDLAMDKNIKIGSENALSILENEKLIDLVQKDNFYLYFDNSNPIWMGGFDSVSLLKRFSKNIIEYHYKDEDSKTDADNRNFVPLFTGKSIVKECIDEMKKNHFSGYLHLENSYHNLSNEEAFENLKRDIIKLKEYIGG